MWNLTIKTILTLKIRLRKRRKKKDSLRVSWDAKFLSMQVFSGTLIYVRKFQLREPRKTTRRTRKPRTKIIRTSDFILF